MKSWSNSSSSPRLPEGARSQGADSVVGHAAADGVVDAHVHIFPPEIIQRRETYLDRDTRFGEIYSSPKARMATAEEVVAHMKECGVGVAVVMGFPFRDLGLCRLVNDYVIESVRIYQGRLAGLACVPVGAGSSEAKASLAELERCLDAGLVGCGELAPNAYDPSFAHLAGLLRERQAPLLVHASEPVGHKYAGKGTFTPAECVALAEACRGTPLVFAHMGGGLFVYELMPEVREALSHVYYDTAAVPYLYRPLVYRVAILCAGANKLLFGSDYPLLSPRRYEDDLRAVLSDEERVTVTQDNACRVYRLGASLGKEGQQP
ncbi:MAG: amidohydrolase [Thermoleophilia bacterium]|nr:amidohydrolase [Thermoleophilia bacterium]